MLSVHERAQLVAAARLYYESNLTQAQIAQRLNVSRPSVSKMLARARELGIVHIEIRAGDEGKADLLQRLQSQPSKSSLNKTRNCLLKNNWTNSIKRRMPLKSSWTPNRTIPTSVLCR